MVFWSRKKKEEPSGVSPASSGDSSETSGGLFATLRGVLNKTAKLLQTDIRDLWKSEGRLVDDDFLRDLFAILIRSDIGTETATKIREQIQTEYRGRVVKFDEIIKLIRAQVLSQLQQGDTALASVATGPTVILVVGVNGSGKTTSIAKLANRLTKDGNKVLLAAGDTFRAAAVEQLTIWSERIGCSIVKGDQGSDPATVAYKATEKAKNEGFDICIIDTAGRLQTQTNLMQQLDKIRRVIGKQIENAPHEVLLVLDATAGQNAISQAKGFSAAAGCTGIVLSKLDGTAKGGVVVPIRQQFNLPVKFIGVGEKLDDMQVFDPVAFTEALFNFDK
jgi:fused signal recognition particle receptor